MSKGSNRRPMQVSQEQFEENWERVFGENVNQQILDAAHRLEEEIWGNSEGAGNDQTLPRRQ